MSAPSCDVERHLAQRLVAVGRVHLIGALVAAVEGCVRADRVAERAVKRRGVFRRIGHDPDVREAGLVERVADRADPAVHHVRRRDDVAAGLGLHQGLAHQDRDGLVVVDMTPSRIMPSWPWEV